ncbi:hypothetical protein LLEC1_03962 [Akanthomyces lecanii]|uniref:Uncharacterized protein n=1 Tax=Cordyceps confragosa TaxID=2714763 RepID=A0A179IHJ3_CORDF|nr:hypothetical protein LLEC1_03962 [Akanthomyces lecanii]
MPCSAPGVSPANITGMDKLQYAAIERAQIEKLTEIVDALENIQVPTIRKDALGDLSIALGAQLNVDEGPSSPSDFSETFFGPCDWPLEVLEYETYYDRPYWRDLDPQAVDQAILLLIPRSISLWLRRCLNTLRHLVPDLWDFYRYVLHSSVERLRTCQAITVASTVTSHSRDIALTLRSSPGTIRSEIGLHVPDREFHPQPWRAAPYYEYYAPWVMFASVASEMPHAVCIVLDSGTPDNQTILLSEAEGAAALVKFQLQDGSYTDHHTKPVLVATILRNQTARLTQACFDGKQNRLVLRQSRTLDLSGAAPSPDAWTLLRWIASQPVGETRYATGDAEVVTRSDNPASLAPRISV